MSKPMSKLDSKTLQLLRDPAKRRAWVKYQVHLQGKSLAQVATDAGVKRSTLYTVFVKTYPRMEKVVADAVGLPPAVLFPERYDDDGLPTYRMGRPKKSTAKVAKDSTQLSLGNVRIQDVA
jgi:Ner family transcriptional regulator